MIAVFDWFERWADYTPDKVAASEYETGREFTYAQIHNLSGHIAFWFEKELNLGKGDRIAMLAENCLEYIALFAVAQKTGVILVPLNYRLTEMELDHLLSDCEPTLAIVEEKFIPKVQNSSRYGEIRLKVRMEDFSQRCNSLIASGETSNYKSRELHENDPVFLIFTSGTTAFPKGSVYTHKMLFWNSINTQMRLDLTSSDRSINCAPPFHTGSWNVLETPFLHHGAYTLMMKNFNADVVLDALEKYELTIFWAVPTMLKMMADSAVFEKADLAKVRYVIVGGEAMPIPLIEKWHQKGILVRQGYGLTEVGPNVTSLNHQDAIRKQGSIGKPNFYYQVKLVDEQNIESPPGETGEFVIKAPTVTPGYWNNEEATRNTIVDGWFHTGDLMRCDEEGYYYVVDRLKNMYISGGENVYPAEVERVLLTHPAVEAVIITGVPDEKWGESGKAFVVRKKGIEVSEEMLINYCRERMAKYKIPKYVDFLDELPKNDAGKIDRKKLKN
ncbi:MAG: long-chain fatty acid--CoA ligase [Bacteroidales bacterium]|nr:long-chain fatty acid--CoA ligase [Bacteroidales bacterium]